MGQKHREHLPGRTLHKQWRWQLACLSLPTSLPSASEAAQSAQASLKRRTEELAALRDGSRVEGDFARQGLAQAVTRADAAEAASAELRTAADRLQAEAASLQQDLASSKESSAAECASTLWLALSGVTYQAASCYLQSCAQLQAG